MEFYGGVEHSQKEEPIPILKFRYFPHYLTLRDELFFNIFVDFLRIIHGSWWLIFMSLRNLVHSQTKITINSELKCGFIRGLRGPWRSRSLVVWLYFLYHDVWLFYQISAPLLPFNWIHSEEFLKPFLLFEPCFISFCCLEKRQKN